MEYFMKVFLTVFFISSMALAANENESKVLLEKESKTDATNLEQKIEKSEILKSSKLGERKSGFSLGIKTGVNSEFERTISSNKVVSAIRENELDQNPSFSIGYHNIATDNIGFSVIANYLRYELDGFDANYVRLDGNINFGLHQHIYVFGGANVSEYVGGDSNESVVVKPYLGFQFGVGGLLTERIGFSLSYYEINDASKDTSFGEDIDIDDKISAIELGTELFF
jgi:hypothetical protein